MDRRSFVKAGGAAGIALATSAFSWPGMDKPRRYSVLVAGAKTMLPYVTKLAEEFRVLHPNVDIVVEGGGGGAGLLALRRGAIDLGLMEREMAAGEEDLAVRSVLMAKDAIGIVVHPSNPLTGLGREAIRAVFEGAVRDWGALGGTPGPITVYSRRLGSATRVSLEDFALGGGEVTAAARQFDSASAMAKAVAGDASAIGYLALKHFTPAVRPLAVEEVAMERSAILVDLYPYCRPLYLLSKGEPAGPAGDFLAYCLSAAAQDKLEEYGVIPVY